MLSSSNSITAQEELSPGQQILKWLQENRVSAPKESNTINAETIKSFLDGEKGITLKDFTDLYSYNTIMSNIYGDSSANPLNNTLNRFLLNPQKEVDSAKGFLEAMEERGVSNKSALKLYTALKTYSINTSFFNKNSFVNAKI